MKSSFSKKLMIAAAAAVTLAACSSSPYPGYEKAENGLYYQFYVQNENAVKPAMGDVVKVKMLYKNGKDSVLFDSRAKDPRKPEGMDYLEMQLPKSTFKGSFEDALGMMGVGDSASFKISADSVYLKTFGAPKLPPYIEPGSMLTFEVKLEKITSKADAEAQQKQRMEEQQKMMKEKTDEELAKLAKYLADKKITAQPTASGIYYIETTKGKGPSPKAGQYVKVAYTGRLLDGTVFDTSDEKTAKAAGTYKAGRPYEPYEFPLGQQQVIPGWDEGLMLMKVGSKGKLIVPSSMAYGPQAYGPIPGFSTLEFDVELVGISDQPTAPQEPAAATVNH
ncbi:MAG: FKBP-type peptidyl-prolyl cis-trans isomerase [Bacteroidia bacterium]